MGKDLTGARSLQRNIGNSCPTVDWGYHEQTSLQGISRKAIELCGTARVSVTEEPDAGKPHVRICMGGSSQEEFLPCLPLNFYVSSSDEFCNGKGVNGQKIPLDGSAASWPLVDWLFPFCRIAARQSSLCGSAWLRCAERI